MANAPTPPMPSPTPFWGLGFRFEEIGRWFDDTYRDIKDIWLLGKWLAWPFYFVGYAFNQARDLSWDADSLIKDIKRWVDGLVSGNTFRELAYNLAWHLHQFIVDPGGWLRDRVRDISTDLYTILVNARGWLEVRLTGIFPFLNDIRYNPSGWLRGLLSTAFGYAIYVLIDPDTYLRGKLSSLYPKLVQFALAPTGYVINLLIARYPFLASFFSNPGASVIGWVESLNGELRELFSNPTSFIRDRFLSLMGVDYDPSLGFTGTILDALLRRTLTLSGTVRARVTTLVCDVIVSFL